MGLESPIPAAPAGKSWKGTEVANGRRSREQRGTVLISIRCCGKTQSSRLANRDGPPERTWQLGPSSKVRPSVLSLYPRCPEAPGPCGEMCRSQLTALQGGFTWDVAVLRMTELVSQGLLARLPQPGTGRSQPRTQVPPAGSRERGHPKMEYSPKDARFRYLEISNYFMYLSLQPCCVLEG